MYKKGGKITLFITLLWAFPFFVAHAGFGVSPSYVEEDRLVPGSYMEKTIYLVQGNPEVPVDVKVEVESKDIKDWFSFDQKEVFTIPEKVQQFPLTVKIQVPQDQALGSYKGAIRITTVPRQEGAEDGTVVIALGGQVNFNFVVGNNVVEEYEILSLDILDIKQNEDPAVEVKIKNTGNVEAAPAGASFELFNKFGQVRLGFSEYNKFDKIKSFTEDVQYAIFPIDIKFSPGEYWGDVKVYDEDGKIIGQVKTVFNVRESSTSDRLKDWIVSSILIILPLVVLFFVFKLLKGFFKKRKAIKQESNNINSPDISSGVSSNQ